MYSRGKPQVLPQLAATLPYLTYNSSTAGDANVYRFLVDGYNLMHAAGMVPAGKRASFQANRKRFLDWLANGEGPRQACVSVIFDAQEGRSNDGVQPYRNLLVCYAYKETADDWIEKAIVREQIPRLLVVVSNDRRIQDAARRRKAEAWSCEDFTDWLETGFPPALKPLPDSPRRAKLGPPESDKPTAPPTAEEVAQLAEAFQMVLPSSVKPLRPNGR
jgi:predicted RNA-binding protein with PIN domain